jgi:hypothetical protein
MLVHDGKNEAKLFADLLASLRATGKFPSSRDAAAASPSSPTLALVANTRSDVAAAEDELRVAAAEARAAAAESKMADAVLQNAKLLEQLAEVKLENARLRAGRL